MSESQKDRRGHLAAMFARQGGKCHICGEPAILDYEGGKASRHLSAVRFRIKSGFGEKGRPRPRVMAHLKCAQERSDQIQDSIPVEERWTRSQRFPTEFYGVPDKVS